MALIECPECKNKISDQAESCPKCGYELKTPAASEKKNKISLNNGNLKYVIIVVAIIAICYFMFGQSSNNNNTGGTGTGNPSSPTTTPSSNSGYSVYTDPYLGISFEIPNGYKVTTDKEGYVYVGQNIDGQGPLIPYIIVGRYDNFNNETTFLNSFTEYMKKECSDLKIVIDLLSGVVGNRTVYGIAYSYSSNNHLIIDNRYAVLINGKVYMVGSKEENTNTSEINSVAEHILSTLTEGGK